MSKKEKIEQSLEEQMLEEAGLEIEPVEIEPAVPEAQVVFDAAMADEWLKIGYKRLRWAFESVRFDPAGMPEDKLEFLLFLAAESILGQYKFLRPLREGRGVIYVPECLVGAPVFSDFERGEVIGLYVALRRK